MKSQPSKARKPAAPITVEVSPTPNEAPMTNRRPASDPIANAIRLGSHGLDLDRRVRRANRWREQYNPIRGLTISRAVTLIESYGRGDMADLQWTYEWIEGGDADLFALVERRTSALVGLDWSIKQTPEKRRDKTFDQALADEQAAALREAYDRIDNLTEAIEHLGTATFRGFAHLEKHRDHDGAIVHLEPCDQWNVVREGRRGPWKYNPEARQTTWESISEDMRIDPAHWIIRDTKRHVDRIALVKFIRSNLGQKDWDSFIEIYGIPGVIIIGPPQVPVGKEAEYESAAASVAEGGSGYLPHGSAAHTSDGARGVNPFRDHLRWLQEQLILAGTGGLLTMLAQSGSGTLGGNAHQDTFELIARAEARKLSEILQAQVDTEVLGETHPGRRRLAYWELAGEEQADIGEIIDHAQKLSVSGYRFDPAELSERTGYQITLKPEPAALSPYPASFQNRLAPRPSPLAASAIESLAKATAADLQPIRTRLERILQIDDPDVLRNRLVAFRADLPSLLRDINADPEAARVLEDTMAAALLNGYAARSERPANRT